jgi:outer membrane protein
MKKIIISSAVALSLSTNAFGLVGNDIEFGIGTYAPKLSGFAGYGTQATSSTIDFSNAGIDQKKFGDGSYFYADFAHFVPLIPNFRFERVAYSHSGTSSQTINWDNTPINGEIKLDLNVDQKDFILYWGVPFLETVSLDIFAINYGLDIKNLSGDISLNNSKASFDETLPTLHLDIRVSLPMLPINLEGYMNTLSYDGAKIENSEIKLSGEFEFIGFDGRIDLGYRSNNLRIPTNLVDDTNIDLQSSGMFVGVSAKF